MALPVLAAGAALLTVPVLATAVFIGSGAAEPPPSAGTTCTVTTESPAAGAAPVATAPTAVPAAAAGVQLTGEQVANARAIVATTKALGLPAQAAAVALMTARQESSLLVLANPTVPGSTDHPYQGLGRDHDSVGLFQQRPSQGWGTVAQLMDPTTSTSLFLRALQQVPNWQQQPAWQAAQAVQRSADGTAYQQWTPLGTALTTALWDDTAGGSITCTSGGTNVTGPGGTFEPQACSVRPDPSTGRGCLTPRMANIAVQLMAQGWPLVCWDRHAWNPRSDHPQGRACDATPGRGGVLPTPEQKARGDALAEALLAGASQTGVNYVIWYGRINSGSGWRPYNGGGVYDAASITGGHYDHVHVNTR